MRRLLRSMLNGFGVRDVAEADNGADALQLVKQRNFDIILTDWEMPIIDGLELTRLVRDESNESPYVPVIMLTAYGERQKVMAARDMGVTEYLVKPVSAKQLFLRIQECIANPRTFVRTKTYFGPDRRRFQHPGYDRAAQRHDDVGAATADPSLISDENLADQQFETAEIEPMHKVH